MHVIAYKVHLGSEGVGLALVQPLVTRKETHRVRVLREAGALTLARAVAVATSKAIGIAVALVVARAVVARAGAADDKTNDRTSSSARASMEKCWIPFRYPVFRYMYGYRYSK